jgi:hypothetical protein
MHAHGSQQADAFCLGATRLCSPLGGFLLLHMGGTNRRPARLVCTHDWSKVLYVHTSHTAHAPHKNADHHTWGAVLQVVLCRSLTRHDTACRWFCRLPCLPRAMYVCLQGARCLQLLYHWLLPCTEVWEMKGAPHVVWRCPLLSLPQYAGHNLQQRDASHTPTPHTQHPPCMCWCDPPPDTHPFTVEASKHLPYMDTQHQRNQQRKQHLA